MPQVWCVVLCVVQGMRVESGEEEAEEAKPVQA